MLAVNTNFWILLGSSFNFIENSVNDEITETLGSDYNISDIYNYAVQSSIAVQLLHNFKVNSLSKKGVSSFLRNVVYSSYYSLGFDVETETLDSLEAQYKDIEEDLGVSLADFYRSTIIQAARQYAYECCLGLIAEAEGLDVISEEEKENYLADIIQYYSSEGTHTHEDGTVCDIEKEIREYYTDDVIKYEISTMKAFNVVIENGTIKEK